jgi:DNA-binding MarR family transcriptional regulator
MPAAQSSDLRNLGELASHLRLGVTRLARRLRRESAPGMTPTLLAALATVERHGPMTASDLAAHEQIRKPTCTRLIVSLTERGLVERRPDPLDGRVAWLHVTAEGRRRLQGVRRRGDEYLARRIRRLPPDDIETLARAADILEHLTEGDR